MSMAVVCTVQTRGDVLDALPDPDVEAIGLERWPLGRVVAVQENAIRSTGDDEKIAAISLR